MEEELDAETGGHERERGDGHRRGVPSNATSPSGGSRYIGGITRR